MVRWLRYVIIIKLRLKYIDFRFNDCVEFRLVVIQGVTRNLTDVGTKYNCTNVNNTPCTSFLFNRPLYFLTSISMSKFVFRFQFDYKKYKCMLRRSNSRC